MQKKSLEKLFNHIKITPLRLDIISILHDKPNPMGAYEILAKLKEKRPNAEPPTVYRVLQFLVKNELVHRIKAQNAYICCSHIENKAKIHNAILLLCTLCQRTVELIDDDIFHSIKKFSQKYKIAINDTVIEINGLCSKCNSKNAIT